MANMSMKEAGPPSRRKGRARIVADGGVAMALSLVLSHVVLYRFPQGGSVTLGSMVPMWFFARRHGLRWGVFAGACVGGLQFCLTPSPIVHWLQPLLDYGLAYGAMGLVALWPRLPFCSVLTALGLRYAIHVLSGWIFYRDFAFQSGRTPWLYSAAYNAAYLLPDALAAFWIFALVRGRVEALSAGTTKPGASRTDSMHRVDLLAGAFAALFSVLGLLWLALRLKGTS